MKRLTFVFHDGRVEKFDATEEAYEDLTYIDKAEGFLSFALPQGLATIDLTGLAWATVVEEEN